MEVFILEFDNQHLILFDNFLQMKYLLQQIFTFKANPSSLLILFSQMNLVGRVAYLVTFLTIAGVIMFNVSLFAGRF
jgi:hypothetical protein